jgi:dolichyl-phosphate beta-glucosyltransferase
MGFGSRIKKLGSEIDRRTKRHIIGRVFATFANGIVKVPIYDTQCGAKYFHHSLIETNFQEPFISKWLFDIEIICRVLSTQGKAFFLQNAIEVPLKRWKEKGESKIRFKDFFKFPLELWEIRKMYSKRLKG